MKKLYIAFIAAFLAIIILPAVFVFTTADKTFSDNENRMLQTAPELNWKSISKGDFQEELTAYISDQFPARDTWTALGTNVKKLMGFKDIGGAYLGSDGYYFEKITEKDINEPLFRVNLTQMNDFAAKNSGIPTTALLIPAAGTVMQDKLPKNAQMYNPAKLYDIAKYAMTDVNVPDLYSELQKHSGEELYYHTDHHWQTYGAAQIAYKMLMGDKAACDAAPELFSDSFLGTTYSKTLDSAAKCDSVYTVPVPEGVSVTADGKAAEYYYTAAQNEKDKYKVFFGGNFGEVVITGGTHNGKTLLVIKDSYANSLVPFLTYDYETIIMLDLRYYMDSAQKVVEQMNVDEILFVFEMSGLSNNTNISKLVF